MYLCGDFRRGWILKKIKRQNLILNEGNYALTLSCFLNLNLAF